KPSDKLAALMAKRDKDDFLFVAGLDDEHTMVTNLKLDKDLSGNMSATFADEKQVAEHVDKFNEGLEEMVSGLIRVLGDKAEVLKKHLEKGKATADGKNIKASLSIPGSAIESILKKD